MFSSCNNELKTFLKERSPVSLAETKKLADNYLDARMNFQSDGDGCSKINRPMSVAVIQSTQNIIS